VGHLAEQERPVEQHGGMGASRLLAHLAVRAEIIGGERVSLRAGRPNRGLDQPGVDRGRLTEAVVLEVWARPSLGPEPPPRSEMWRLRREIGRASSSREVPLSRPAPPQPLPYPPIASRDRASLDALVVYLNSGGCA
jgi:hypothetical protein